MNVAYMVRDNGACSYYRMWLPLFFASQNDGMNVRELGIGSKPELILDAFKWSDVIVIPRVGEPKLAELIFEFQKIGKKVAIDHDDDMFKVSPFNVAYQQSGVENVLWKVNEHEIVPLWVDGKKDFNIEKNKEKLATARIAMNRADMVTVTTDVLADIYREYNQNVKVLPNCIDLSQWQRLPLLPHDEIRLYWSGGASHYEDWCIISKVLPVIMEKYKNTRLVILGQKFDGTLKRIPKDRIDFHSWVATPAYPYKSAILDPDICIIPLKPTDFAKCKSAIKWIEMSALKVPCVVSYTSPYKEIAEEDTGVWIEDNDNDAWVEGISLLIEDAAMRKSIAESANKYVIEHFDIQKKWHLWRDAYKELL